MASKRDGSILDFFTKKIKNTTLFSTEEIELTEVSTISEDKTHDASSLIQNAPLVDLLNPSNINDLPEIYDESENESEFFVSSKSDIHCCNSSKPYHPVTDDELALTTIDKRSCQKWWFMDHSWLTFCKISNRKCFSLICDETCEESTLEQLCFGIRSVNDNYEIFEDVLGLYELSRQNAEAIVEVIFDILTRCGLNISDSRGQSYDGATSMSGIYGGVSALVLKQQSKAFFVHCNAHCLDLAVHDLTNECPTISNCILFSKDIIDFVRRSSKHISILKEISNQLSMPYSNLASLCPTRWTRRAESYNSLLNNYELVQEVLYTLIEEKGAPGIKANGLHEQMNRFYLFFGLKLGYLLFSATEKLSRIIQSSSCCLQD
ncbi:unnamed protein product, partial [Rotaria socialis]